LWYTRPWSFEKYFQLTIPNPYIQQRHPNGSLSLSDTIITFDFSTINESPNILPLLNLQFRSTSATERINQTNYHCIDASIRKKIRTDHIIVIDCLDRLRNNLYPACLRSIHILFHFSRIYPIINWNSLRALSDYSLLKSLRITVYDLETILEEEDCQVIIERLPMLIDFVFCFRRYTGPDDDKNDSFNIHRKSILNLYHHISMLLFRQQFKMIIEADGCGLSVWL